MKITNKEQFNELPNGTIFKLFLSGEEWEEDFGKTPWVIKKDNRLYEINFDNWYDFNDCLLDDGYNVEVIYNKERDI
jgi:hypothetical protein